MKCPRMAQGFREIHIGPALPPPAPVGGAWEGESAFVSELMAADLWGPDPQALCSRRGVEERQSGRGCSQRGHRDPAGSGRLCIEFGFFFGKLWRVLSRGVHGLI